MYIYTSIKAVDYSIKELIPDSSPFSKGYLTRVVNSTIKVVNILREFECS